MSDKLREYVDGVFAPYEGTRSVDELKADLLADLRERFRDLTAEGKDEVTAFELTVDSIGDIEETVRDVSNLSRVLERQVVTRFDASALEGSDFAGAAFASVKFDRSGLERLSLRGATLRDCSFRGGWSSRYYKALLNVDFDGARMDKLTYATLKGLGVDLTTVTVA